MAEFNRVESLDRTLNLQMIETVYTGVASLPFERVRDQYDRLAFIYLQDSCSYTAVDLLNHEPIAWVGEGTSPEAHFYLIQGYSRAAFMELVYGTELEEIVLDTDRYFVFLDMDFTYMVQNQGIPSWELTRPLMVDKQSRIKAVGEAFNYQPANSLTAAISTISSNNSVLRTNEGMRSDPGPQAANSTKSAVWLVPTK